MLDTGIDGRATRVQAACRDLSLLPNFEKKDFLRAVQSIFLQKRHLETADTSTLLSASLYAPPLNMFGADAVNRWFTEKEVDEVVAFANRMAV